MNGYGLIGYPLSHSFSREYFNRKFASEKIRDAMYEHFVLPDISGFPALLKQNPGLRGLNVTIPYKKSIMPYLDRMDASALEAGAVNTILIKDSLLTGYNTDVIGFEKSLSPLLKKNHRGALILGTGGSASAVASVFRKRNFPHLFVSRNPPDQQVIPYSGITREILDTYPVIIHCTPVGMYPDVDACPDVPYDLLGPGNLLFDLVYNPDPSLFLQQGAAAGAAVKSGKEMLFIQAEESWKIWSQAGDSH